MLKFIAAFFLSSIVAVNAQDQGNQACTGTGTPQIHLDALAAINTDRAANGAAAADQGAVKLFAELSAMAVAKLTDIASTCTAAVKYGFDTLGTCCPTDATTNRHTCVRGPTESIKFGGIAGDVDALIGVEVLTNALTSGNVDTEIPAVIASGKAAEFLLNNGGTDVLTGVGIATSGTDIVLIATKHVATDYTECSATAGSPISTTTAAPGGSTTTVAGGSTTTVAGGATTTVSGGVTTTSPSGATHVGVGLATFSAIAMCMA